KRGFTFVRHVPGQPFVPDLDHANELLVAASPADEVADTHWLRADFDAHLVERAIAMGVPYVDRIEVAIHSSSAPWRLSGRRGEETVEITALFLIDATGPAGVLSRALGIDTSLAGMRTSSWTIFSHFEGVRRWEDIVRVLGARTD